MTADGSRLSPIPTVFNFLCAPLSFGRARKLVRAGELLQCFGEHRCTFGTVESRLSSDLQWKNLPGASQLTYWLTRSRIAPI